ncbi:MAG: hypothetical protein ACFFAK_08015 [Promethearchaeota archaeon]
MINQKLEYGFKITDFGEINNDSLNDFGFSLKEFFSKKENSVYDSFLIKSFEFKKHGRNGNSFLLEFEKLLENFIASV